MKTLFLPDEKIKFNTVVLLGDFDGVHTAHRKLVQKAMDLAEENNLKSLVYTFEKSIKKGLNLTSNNDKEKLFEELGIDILAFQRVTPEFFTTSPESFVKDVIVDTLNAKYVVVGENYTFGKNGAGKSHDLKRMLEEYGVKCEICELVQMEEKVVSSTDIRNLLAEGDIKKANKLLNRRYSVSGIVEHGNRIGNTIGFPTVNIRPGENIILPKFGVYAVYVNLNGEKLKGVANVGIKPTVGGKIPLVETNIFGVDDDLYGVYIEVEFESFIREEKKFSDISELKTQIEKDKTEANTLLVD